jgi:hypothetical protein
MHIRDYRTSAPYKYIDKVLSLTSESNFPFYCSSLKELSSRKAALADHGMGDSEMIR